MVELVIKSIRGSVCVTLTERSKNRDWHGACGRQTALDCTPSKFCTLNADPSGPRTFWAALMTHRRTMGKNSCSQKIPCYSCDCLYISLQQLSASQIHSNTCHRHEAAIPPNRLERTSSVGWRWLGWLPVLICGWHIVQVTELNFKLEHDQ